MTIIIMGIIVPFTIKCHLRIRRVAHIPGGRERLYCFPLFADRAQKRLIGGW